MLLLIEQQGSLPAPSPPLERSLVSPTPLSSARYGLARPR